MLKPEFKGSNGASYWDGRLFTGRSREAMVDLAFGAIQPVTGSAECLW